MSAKGTKPETNQTQCRNILIHGYCKFADKGCAFRHDGPSTTASPTKPPDGIIKKKQLNADSPSFTPSFVNPLGNISHTSPNQRNTGVISSTSSSPKVDVVPFYPKSKYSFNYCLRFITDIVDAGNGVGKYNPESSSFNPESVFSPRSGGNTNGNGGGNISGANISPVQQSSVSAPPSFMLPGQNQQPPQQPQHYQLQQTSDDFNNLMIDPHQPPIPNHSHVIPPPPPPHFQTPISGNPDMLFQPHSAFPLQYHLYAPSPMGKHRESLSPHERKVEDFFIRNDLREELQRKNEAILQKLPNSSLPDFVHIYHSLVPLDTNIDKNARLFGYPTWAYKAMSNRDGKIYCLRRIEGFRLTNEHAIKIVQKWRGVDSPNIVHLHEAFTTRAFGDNSLVFVYDYYPLSMTLFDTYFGPLVKFQHPLEQTRPIDEQIIWGYIIQLVNALKKIHEAGLAARIVDPTRILVVKKGRIRLNCCGIFDILQFESTNGVITDEEIKSLQQEDFVSIGRLILILASKSTIAASQPLSRSLDIISKQYSPDLTKFIQHLLSSDSQITTSSLITLLADKTIDYLSSSLYANDDLESQLSQELENSRLVRLLCKFGFINERPEYDHDPNWSESGDRYLIKLFRDYVFHQVDELGNPVVDMGHVLSSLNKLDAGIDEPILLVSRDEQSCLVVTYKELKSCMISAFRDLTK